MYNLIDGKKVASEIKKEIAEEVIKLKAAGIKIPHLVAILVGNNGMTLYIYTKDGPNLSNCTGQCLINWPALVTKGNPTLGAGVDKSLVGTAALADGSKIVTYNKMPLYYWAKDTKAGDTTGQNVGSVWFVISPDGNVVGK